MLEPGLRPGEILELSDGHPRFSLLLRCCEAWGPTNEYDASDRLGEGMLFDDSV